MPQFATSSPSLLPTIVVVVVDAWRQTAAARTRDGPSEQRAPQADASRTPPPPPHHHRHRHRHRLRLRALHHRPVVASLRYRLPLLLWE